MLSGVFQCATLVSSAATLRPPQAHPFSISGCTVFQHVVAMYVVSSFRGRLPDLIPKPGQGAKSVQYCRTNLSALGRAER
jgi:hypothetical protein